MMNNCNELLEQAESLKKELNNGRNGLNNDGSGKGEWVSSRTVLQDVYRQLLITNLEYALDKKIEQELWNFVFKNHITALQQQVKDKTNTFRSEAQSQLTSFLDAASGFYIQLLDDLCQAFHINIPYRVHSTKLVFLKDSKTIKCKSIAQPERPSCQYMCQHCLVHLGDIARYRNQIAQAESYYRYASQLVPSNGQPYNQLAILAAAGGDVLSTAFYYCRSLAVKCPFPGSDTNLRRQLAKIMNGDEPRHTKISTSELVKFCLKFHACIYLKQNESELNGMVEKLSGYVRAHLRAGSLSRQQMIHITFLNLFSLHYLSPNGVNTSGEPSPASVEDEGLSEEGAVLTVKTDDTFENTSWSALLTFTMHMLGGLLACVPAHSDDSADLEHHALPSIKLTLDWLVSNSSTLHRPEVAHNSRVWPRLAKVLNALGNQDKANNMDNLHLPEDLEVRGFVGLKGALSRLDFLAGIGSGVPSNMEHSCRCYRLYQVGIAIAGVNADLLSFGEENNGTVFSSSISPSPQHVSRLNGLEVQSEEDEDEEVEDEVQSFTSSPKHVDQPSREVFPVKSSFEDSSTKRGQARTKGVLKVLTDDHTSGRKRNRAPRMQNVAVQIKPDHKLKVIKEEEGAGHSENFVPVAESESGRSNSESSQGDVSPSAIGHTRSVHRVTFATAQQVSPIQYPHDDSPSPVGPNYMDQVSAYPKSTPQMTQQSPYVHNMHMMSQQMGPIYRQPPSANPILTGPFARRPVAPYGYQQSLITRPHIQLNPYQHAHPSNPPPHPAELPKPVFQTSLFPQTCGTESLRASSVHGQMNPETNMEQMMKLSRPTDFGYLQQIHSNPGFAVSNMSPTGPDSHLVPRPNCPTMAAQFSNRPSVNASVMQQLRLQGIALPNELQSDISVSNVTSDPSVMSSYHTQNQLKFNYQNQGMEYQFASAKQRQQQQMAARSQPGLLSNAAEALSTRQDADLSRMAPEMNRNYLQAMTAGGSNNTSSTSSPTPGSLNQLNNGANASTSPQGGALSSMNYSGNVLGQGLSSMLLDRNLHSSEMDMRRPNTLSGSQSHHSSSVGFVGSPSQKLTPTGLGRFITEQQFNKDGMPSAMFRASQAATPNLQQQPQDLRPSRNQNVEAYSLPKDRVKAIFDERSNLDILPQMQKKPIVPNQPAPPQSNAFQDSLLSKEDKDSYKLFPVTTDNLWENRSYLGSIGSERAAAQQGNNLRYSPWGGQQPTQAPTLAENTDIPRTSENLHSQSFWSTPMVTSGPSALEQLIRQQQNVTRDKSPP